MAFVYNMQDVTAGELIDASIEEADMVGSEFISRTQWLRWVNQELDIVYDLLVASHQSYFIKTHDVQGDNTDERLDASRPNYALPVDFYKLISAMYLDGTKMFSMKRMMLQDFHRFTQGNASALSSNTGTNMQYIIIDKYIFFFPLPAGGEKVALLYVPHRQAAIDEKSVVMPTVPIAWKDYVIHGCAARALLKEESDAMGQMMLKGAAERRIKESASERDEAQSAVVTDVYNRFGRDGELY